MEKEQYLEESLCYDIVSDTQLPSFCTDIVFCIFTGYI